MNRVRHATQATQSYGMIVVDAAYNTVIVQQYGKTWSFPKGRIEATDKDGKACASREFREETGYTAPPNASKLQFVLDPVHQLSGVKDPLAVTLIRPTYQDDGWTGPDRQITFYLVRTKDLGALEFNLKRDPAITDMKILDIAWMSDKQPIRKKGMDHYYVDVNKDEFFTTSNNGQGIHYIPPVHYTMHHKDRQAVFHLMGLLTARMEEANERQSNN